MPRCCACGQPTEPGEFRDKHGRYWHHPECTEIVLDRWIEIQNVDDKLEKSEKFEEALKRSISDYLLPDDFCVYPKKQCRPDTEKCLKCWYDYLMGVTE